MSDHRWIVPLLILLLSPVILAISSSTQSLPDGDAVVGGKLYDNWFNVMDEETPENSQPLWALQTESTREGELTWRCVTCHGWDYKGVDGAFGKGSEKYTGFPSIMSIIGQPNDDVRGWLDGTNNPDHDFSIYLNTSAQDDLIAFLRTRLIETELLVDGESRASLGNKSAGSNLYDETCEECHGVDGENLNLGSAVSPQFLGDMALRDPWQFVHKTRFGHPGSKMPAVDELGWTLQHVADVLAFAQELPLAQPLTEAELNPDAFPQVDFSEQGDTTGITIGAIIIVAIILGGVGMVLLRDRMSIR